MISLAKALFSLALLCLLTEKAGAEESCILNASTSTAVLQCAEFSLLPANARIPEDAESFQRVFDAPGWNRRSGTQWRFPGGADVLWLRFKIENRSEETVTRLLINEFAFADSLKLFWIQDGSVRTDEQGLQQSWIEKHIDYRLPAYSLRLEPGENRFLMRLEARSGKILSLKLEEPGSSGQRENFPGYLFPVFLTGAITAFVLSLFIFLSLQERIGLLYCIYVASMVAYMFSWEGYARQYLFPDHGTWSIAALSSSGALAGWAVIALWRELLILSVHAPLINRIMRWIGGGYIIAAVYSLIPGADFRLVDVAVYILPALFIPLALFSGVHVVRIGFRPALFSLIGFTGFLICIPFFFYAGMGWIQGSDWTRNPLYVGYLFEFAMFLISVGLRIHFLRNVQQSTMAPGTVTRVASSDDPATANRIDNSAESDKKSKSATKLNQSTGPLKTKPTTRLSKLNVGELSRMLDSLMTEEQLYCDEDLTQERLASLLEIKRHQLTELLRVVHNTNFYSFINRHRIACARELLIEQPDRSVLSIALASGFNSKSTFNSEFKKQTGMTPVEFRKSGALPSLS
ncbi:MAG TPA: hypothetical protein DEA96_11455 [Leptospiraceae bacterium]|nr:hypothetical protein [Spirochaetaceae bacterium]HBS05576.1 hypothetical protein [Leptospiraceae bacterium]|tara:strand:- start:26815 stop:28539 length:1725 start_codon:yes stop_codon:yes gene_type:complete